MGGESGVTPTRSALYKGSLTCLPAGESFVATQLLKINVTTTSSVICRVTLSIYITSLVTILGKMNKGTSYVC